MASLAAIGIIVIVLAGTYVSHLGSNWLGAEAWQKVDDRSASRDRRQRGR